jgi:hypothetical protein
VAVESAVGFAQAGGCLGGEELAFVDDVEGSKNEAPPGISVLTSRLFAERVFPVVNDRRNNIFWRGVELFLLPAGSSLLVSFHSIAKSWQREAGTSAKKKKKVPGSSGGASRNALGEPSIQTRSQSHILLIPGWLIHGSNN